MATHITGILLQYYEPYLEQAVAQFDALLRTLPGRHSVVVVRNGPARRTPSIPGIEVIAGDNSLHEFSGWEAGLAHCRANGLVDRSDLLVFANDTFCYHNKFGPLTRFAFRRGLRGLLQAPSAPALAGEVHRLGKPYLIDGLECDRWVATYLFGMSRGLLQHMRRLTPSTPMADFYRDDAGKIGFSDRISPNLAEHVEQWLTGSGRTRWQGTATGEPRTLGKLQGKANSVLCEKYLTARALDHGAVLSDVFASTGLRQLRRIEALPTKLNALPGRPAARILGG